MNGHKQHVLRSVPQFRRVILAGAGFAVFGLTAFLAIPPAPAIAAESEAGTATFLRDGSFGWAAFASAAGHPIRRRAPYYEERGRSAREEPQGFLNLGGGVFDPSDQPGNGFYGVFAVGSEVAKALDLGVQVSWFHDDADGEEVVFRYVNEAGIIVEQVVETESADIDLLPLMGIARLRFPFSRAFQPYVGGGAGYEWLFIQGIDLDGFPFDREYGGFGAQLMGGVNINASESVGLYGEATYNFSTVDDEFFDTVLGIPVKEEINMDGLAVHGGLRFRF